MVRSLALKIEEKVQKFNEKFKNWGQIISKFEGEMG